MSFAHIYRAASRPLRLQIVMTAAILVVVLGAFVSGQTPTTPVASDGWITPSTIIQLAILVYGVGVTVQQGRDLKRRLERVESCLDTEIPHTYVRKDVFDERLGRRTSDLRPQASVMWTYVQRTGGLYTAAGELFATGYAGMGVHRNQPESDELKNIGPLPRGRYAIGPPRATTAHGPYVLRLTSDPANDMKGRAGFLVHGDSTTRPGTASNGCIILPRRIRERLYGSGDHTLRVVADVTDL